LTPRGEKGTSRYIPEVGEAPFSNHPTRPSQGGFFFGRFPDAVFCFEPAGHIIRPGSCVFAPDNANRICTNAASLAGGRERRKLLYRVLENIDA
jgi:hypothetical protein